MNEAKKILEQNGKEGVKLYRESLEKNDRVATGKTRDSIRYETKESKTNYKLTFYADDHIRDLETGQTAQQIQAKNSPSLFDQIAEWVAARNIGGGNQLLVTQRIYRSLLENGWNNTLPNRNANGGTDGIITNVDDIIVKNVKNDVKKASKFIILGQIKT